MIKIDTCSMLQRQGSIHRLKSSELIDFLQEKGNPTKVPQIHSKSPNMYFVVDSQDSLPGMEHDELLVAINDGQNHHAAVAKHFMQLYEQALAALPEKNKNAAVTIPHLTLSVSDNISVGALTQTATFYTLEARLDKAFKEAINILKGLCS